MYHTLCAFHVWLACCSWRTSLAGLLQLADFKKSMEMWSLLRLAFASARVALGRSGQVQIAQRSFSGVCSSDAVCARHSLALASLVAREPGGASVYVANIGPPLQNNVEMAKRMEAGACVLCRAQQCLCISSGFSMQVAQRMAIGDVLLVGQFGSVRV